MVIQINVTVILIIIFKVFKRNMIDELVNKNGIQ